MHCAVVCGEEIYCLGGHHAKQMAMLTPEPCPCVMVYSPWRNGWRATGLLNKKRGMTAICSVNGKVMVFGGLDTTFKQGQWAGEYKDMGSCEVYDPKKSLWSMLPPMPYRCNSGRSSLAMASLALTFAPVESKPDPIDPDLRTLCGGRR